MAARWKNPRCITCLQLLDSRRHHEFTQAPALLLNPAALSLSVYVETRDEISRQ